MRAKPTGDSCFPGCGYTPEQTQFLMAMDALKTRLRRMPTPAEVLQEAIRLGYRKTEHVTIKAAMKHLREARRD